MKSRPRYQTPSSAHRITHLSIPPPTYQTVAHQASRMWTLRSSRPTHHLLTIRQAPKRQASSRTRRARRRGHQRRRRLPLLEEGEVYRRHEEEEGYLRVEVRQEAQQGEVGLREDLQEGGEGVLREALVKKFLRHGVKMCKCKRKQYTTGSLLLSNYQVSNSFLSGESSGSSSVIVNITSSGTKEV